MGPRAKRQLCNSYNTTTKPLPIKILTPTLHYGIMSIVTSTGSFTVAVLTELLAGSVAIAVVLAILALAGVLSD